MFILAAFILDQEQMETCWRAGPIRQETIVIKVRRHLARLGARRKLVNFVFQGTFPVVVGAWGWLAALVFVVGIPERAAQWRLTHTGNIKTFGWRLRSYDLECF